MMVKNRKTANKTTTDTESTTSSLRKPVQHSKPGSSFGVPRNNETVMEPESTASSVSKPMPPPRRVSRPSILGLPERTEIVNDAPRAKAPPAFSSFHDAYRAPILSSSDAAPSVSHDAAVPVATASSGVLNFNAAGDRSQARRAAKEPMYPDGYLPTLSSITRAPLTALREVRAELQKTFPTSSFGSALDSAAPLDLEENMGKGKGNGTSEETLFGRFEASRKSEEISTDAKEIAQLQKDLIQIKEQLRAAKVAERRHVPEDSVDVALSGPLSDLQFDAHLFQVAKAAEVQRNLVERALQLPNEDELLRDGILMPETGLSEKRALQRANVADVQGDGILIPGTGPSKRVRKVDSSQPRAQPFTATANFQSPESFAELNDRLKTGSRLSALINTKLENKADFRARWESMNSALPRDVNAQDFVKLVTPTGSPTKPVATSTPTAQSSKWPSYIGKLPLEPPESLTDYYNRRFESLGAEAKELIKKAQKTLLLPAVQPKKSFDAADYTKPFCEFLTENPTVFHAVDYFAAKLTKAGFEKLSERELWNDKLEAGGKYFVERNGSSMIAFSIGKAYKSGNGVAMIAGHVDALAARLKPISTKNTKAGYVQLGVAPYAGALNATWWDRDLGIGGRVLVKDSETGKIKTKLVKLGWPIARIPTLAPHFGVGMMGTNNAETQAVPIIGLDNSDLSSISEEEDAKWKASALRGAQGTFAATQPPKLLKAIAGELNIQNYSSIVNWELELFDTQAAQVGGLEKEFIFAGRVDDKVCSWAAMEGLLAASEDAPEDAGIISLVGVFDDEEIGSLLRQGARGNLLPSVIERISESFSDSKNNSSNVLSQTYANSFLISADVTHAVNPNFIEKYLENHAPRLNIGVGICADSNGHMTTDSVSTSLLQRVAEKCGSTTQTFMIRNDSRSGGTIGPALSSAMGVRSIDAGIPQLSMHSIRATIGSLDPGLGVKLFKGFFEEFESVDKEFE